MSRETLDQFRQQVVLKDQALKERLEATTSPEEMASVVVQASRERGYSFTMEDVLATINEVAKQKNWQFSATEQELSDEQLEAVAGGVAQAFTDNWGCSVAH